MTLHPLQLDPEVEGILREVAADPRSKLLRVRRPTSVRALTEQVPTVGVATAGLTVAERHLVQTYRAEVAYALVNACWHMLTEGSATPNLFSRQAQDGGEMAVPAREATDARLREAISAFRDEHTGGGLQALAGSGESPPSAQKVIAYCELAQQLSPSYHAQVHAMAAMITVGRVAEAEELASDMLRRPHDRRTRAIIMTNLGLSLSQSDHLQDSLKTYSTCCQEDPDYAAGACSRLVVALRLGNGSEVRAAAEWLGHHVSNGDPNAHRLLMNQDQHGRDACYSMDVRTRETLLHGMSTLAKRIAYVPT